MPANHKEVPQGWDAFSVLFVPPHIVFARHREDVRQPMQGTGTSLCGGVIGSRIMQSVQNKSFLM